MKFKKVLNGEGGYYGVTWNCPGCREPHVIPTVGPQAWGFNEDYEKPTLTPSILVYPANRLADDGITITQSPRCHSFIREGQIEFCSDSSHELAGRVVEIPEST